MGRKIFVSYKFADSNVQPLPGTALWDQTTARSYVDELETKLASQDHIYKGERDGESLAAFTDDTIESRLRDRIFDTSTTLVLISPQMREPGRAERNQWIPWEVAYSLRESTRNGRTSGTNAVIAVVLPDQLGRYDYYLEENTCQYCRCRKLHTDRLFPILRANMFNVKRPVFGDCDRHPPKSLFVGESCYIPSIRWDNFTSAIDTHIERAWQIRERVREYDICKTPTA